MTRYKMRRAAHSLFACTLIGLGLVPGIALAEGGKITSRIIGVYANTVGTFLRFELATPAQLGAAWSCVVPTGKTLNGAYAVVVTDYSTTAKVEGTRQVFSTVQSAFLSGRTVEFYSFGCTQDPWNSNQVVPSIYDIVVR